MARQHIYTVLSADDGTQDKWRVVKMERDYENQETYIVQRVHFDVRGEQKTMMLCNCFAASKDTCRHRQMIGIFEEEDAINTRRAYDFDKSRWIDPPKAALETL